MDNQGNKKSFFYKEKEYYCSLELAMELIGGKWKTMMIYHLKDGAARSSELQRSLHGISNKMFTQTARDLERNRIIERTVYPVIPPKVEYKLSELGLSVLPIVLEIAAWANKLSNNTTQSE